MPLEAALQLWDEDDFEGSLTGVNMKKSVLTLTLLYFHLWCALSSFCSWWLFSYGAQTWTSLDTEQLLALLFFKYALVSA